MGCCGEPAPHDEHAKKPGIKQERSCQDCFFLLLFIAFWGGMIAVAVTASKLGEPDRLFYGTDYLGNLCGVNNVAVGKVPANYSRDFTSKPYLFYLFVPPFNQYYKLCVESCPTQTFLLPTSADELICTYNTTPSVENIFPAGSCYGSYASRPILNRCFPTVLQNVTTLIAQKITSDTNTGRAADVSYNILSDVVKSWKYILISAFIALGLGFVWVFLLRLLAGVIVWLTILFVLAALAVTTYVCYQQSNELEQAYNSMPPEEQLDSQHYNILALRYLSYIIAAAAVIIFLMVLFLLRRIQIAIGIIKETSKAVAHMPSLFFFPIFIFILLTGLAAYWLGISALLGTAGNPTYENGRYIGYKADTNTTYLQLYHLFGGFWTLNFILAIGQCTIAGSVASWYWVHDKKDTPWFPVWIALYRTFRYHLGSLAFGSLILAVVQFIRVVLAYLEKKFKGKQFWVARFVIKCMQCCFAYFERFIKFLNKNAYIMIAIYGYSFCHGARRGFELVLTNFLRVAALGFVSKFLMFLGRAAITATTCFISFLLLKANGTVSFYVLPVLLIGIIAFAVATAFMSVYDMAISTMLLCFCEDTDRNDGSAEKPYYMTDSLKSYMDTNHKMCRCCGSGNDDEEK